MRNRHRQILEQRAIIVRKCDLAYARGEENRGCLVRLHSDAEDATDSELVEFSSSLVDLGLAKVKLEKRHFQ